MPQERPPIPRAVASLVSIGLSELRKDARQLIEGNWAEPVRRRTHELAAAVEEACARHRMAEIATLARSLANLTRLTREEAAPLRSALRQKFEEILTLAVRMLSRYSNRHTG